MSTYSNFFSFRDTSHATSSPSKLLADVTSPLFLLVSSRSSLPLSTSLLLSLFFLSRPHSHSNLFERIIHARVMLEMHSREEGSAAIHRVRHSLYFIFCYLLFFFLAIIRRTAGAHIFLVERQSDANRNCTLDISAIGTGFQIFVQVHVRTRCKLGNGALVIDTFHY